MWVAIKGYRYPYRINEDAKVQKYEDGAWTDLNPQLGSRTRSVVYLRAKDGKRVPAPLVTLMADAFMGGRKPGHCIVYRNGLKKDCQLANLRQVTRTECAKIAYKNRRKSVAKIDQDGNVVEVYSSATEAAKRNFLSMTAIVSRCAKKVKDPYRLDGYNYLYEDDTYAINQEKRKAGSE